VALRVMCAAGTKEPRSLYVSAACTCELRAVICSIHMYAVVVSSSSTACMKEARLLSNTKRCEQCVQLSPYLLEGIRGRPSILATMMAGTSIQLQRPLHALLVHVVHRSSFAAERTCSRGFKRDVSIVACGARCSPDRHACMYALIESLHGGLPTCWEHAVLE
jgi:hypothetical protein